MEEKTKRGVLAIRSDGSQSKVEINGTPADILFNWIALTCQVCQVLKIPELALAGMLPQMVADYSRTIKAKNGVEVRVKK